jgi:hypothetical protein
MSLPSSVEAVKNERTEKLFIVLNWDAGGNNISVINPAGEVRDVVQLIFKMDERLRISEADYKKMFSPEQIVRLANYENDRASSIRRVSQEKTAKVTKSSSSRVRTTKKIEGLIESRKATAGRRPAVSWTSAVLTFYRHRIEGLKPTDAFEIVVEGVGTLKMTKAEFQRVFNNVVMDPDYRSQGVFRYMDFPEEARIFLSSANR